MSYRIYNEYSQEIISFYINSVFKNFTFSAENAMLKDILSILSDLEDPRVISRCAYLDFLSTQETFINGKFLNKVIHLYSSDNYMKLYGEAFYAYLIDDRNELIIFPYTESFPDFLRCIVEAYTEHVMDILLNLDDEDIKERSLEQEILEEELALANKVPPGYVLNYQYCIDSGDATSRAMKAYDECLQYAEFRKICDDLLNF